MKHTHTGRRGAGALLMWLGGLLMAAALCLAAYNAWDEYRAGAAAEAVVVELAAVTVPEVEHREPAPVPDIPDADSPADEQMPPAVPEVEEVPLYVTYPEKEMPLVSAGGYDCLGVLELPTLGRRLPVLERCDEQSLKYAPGGYSGSVYEHTMVIAGHNYTSHFGKLGTLKPGDPVYFTDGEGNRFVYAVADLEKLEPTDIEGMTVGDWDLTLFTCTYGNRQRLAVRCFLTD